jgi:transposase
MEVVGRMSGRRRRPDAEALEILAEAFCPGMRVCDVIARRAVSSSRIKIGASSCAKASWRA